MFLLIKAEKGYKKLYEPHKTKGKEKRNKLRCFNKNQEK